MSAFTKNIKRFRRRLPARRESLYFLLGGLVVFAGFESAILYKAAKTPVAYTATGLTTTWLPPTVTRWKTPIENMGKKYNIDPNLIGIIMTLESSGYIKAESADQAKGLLQITPPTAKDIAAKFLKTPTAKYDLFNPETNIEFGTAYLAYLRDEFGTSQQGPDWTAAVELIAAGYNGGPGAANSLDQGKGLNDTQTVIYSRDAFNMWRERHAGSSPTFDRWKERGGSSLIDAAKNQKT